MSETEVEWRARAMQGALEHTQGWPLVHRPRWDGDRYPWTLPDAPGARWHTGGVIVREEVSPFISDPTGCTKARPGHAHCIHGEITRCPNPSDCDLRWPKPSQK